MKMISMPRRAGKTTLIIKMSAATNKYIVVKDIKEAHMISDQAIEMGLNIPFPITWAEFRENHVSGNPATDNLLVDNLDMLIDYLLSDFFRGHNVESATIDSDWIEKFGQKEGKHENI